MPNGLKLILFDVRTKILIILVLLWLSAFWSNPSIITAIYSLSTVCLFVILDLGFFYWKNKKFYFPLSSFVSSLIIIILINASQGILVLWTATVTAFISKQFIKVDHKHIFNPAAFGVVASVLLFQIPISWWASASSGISLFLLPFASFVLYKLKRLQVSLTFLIGYFIYLTVSNNLAASIPLTFDGTLFFFTFIMLPEPITSTISGKWYWVFGFTVLLIAILINITRITVPDPLLTALLIANLLGRISSRK